MGYVGQQKLHVCCLQNPADEGQHSIQTFNFDITEYLHTSQYRSVGKNFNICLHISSAQFTSTSQKFVVLLL